MCKNMLGIENCERKSKYHSVHEAKEQEHRVHRRSKHLRLRIYKCPFCYFYHLTSQARFDKVAGAWEADIENQKKLAPYNRKKSYRELPDLGEE